MAEIVFSEMPPSANGMRNSFVRNGKVMSAKSRTYAAWKHAAVTEAKRQNTATIDGPYDLLVRVQRNWRSKRARDLDNLLKPVSDALVGAGVVRDDCLAERIEIAWADDLGGPAVIALASKAEAGE